MLLRADDCLILSNCRKLLIEKFKALENYCSTKNIRIQSLKCYFIAINTEEKGEIKLATGVIKHENEALYLNSVIKLRY